MKWGYNRMDDHKSCLQEFLSQTESPNPIVLHDAYDIEEITWMCYRLRKSEQFGSDNRLYLQYSSREMFQQKKQELDWTPVINTKKVVFTFSDSENGGEEKCASSVHPSPLAFDEIVEMISAIPRGASGSDFFNMILDGHPYLLTIGWQGMCTFTTLYLVFCKDVTAEKAIQHLMHPGNEREQFLWDANMHSALKYQYEERLPKFWSSLQKLLAPQQVYGMADWFKAFFLAVNTAVGRTFNQRISPAIFFDEHRGIWQRRAELDFGISLEQQEALREQLRRAFLYHKFVGVVRAPMSVLGSWHNYVLKHGPNWYQANPIDAVKNSASANIYGYYLDQDDPKLTVSRQFRFEDLKMYPRETTEKLCEFLRIPWSESCLHITTNGDDGGIVDGTEGFDTTPVYNPHLEHMSVLDYYRIEFLNANNYEVWGYKLRYYDGQQYSKKELQQLFALPFKVESQRMEPWPDWPDAQVIQEFHDWIYQRALEVIEQRHNLPPRDAQGRPKKLVPCLFPDLAPGQRLYTNGLIPAGSSRSANVHPSHYSRQAQVKRYIYGAGNFGHKLGRYFMREGKVLYGFIVSQDAPVSLRMGLPVVNVADFHEKDAAVYIAIKNPEAVREARQHLLQIGLQDSQIIDAVDFIRENLC